MRPPFDIIMTIIQLGVTVKDRTTKMVVIALSIMRPIDRISNHQQRKTMKTLREELKKKNPFELPEQEAYLKVHLLW